MGNWNEWKENSRQTGRRVRDQILDFIITVQDKRAISRTYERLGNALGSPMVLLVLIVVVVSAPVLLSTPVGAQSNSTDIVSDVCNSELSTLATAFFYLFAIGLGGIGMFRLGNGLQKMGSPVSQKKKEGREELKGAGLAIAGAVLLFVMPGLLDKLGLSFSQCVSF